ncbi:exported hypothetical protein [Verrucomicrobia bacterium]|nr:exported hypothetical protein [Verrucomicrobiota bacterium]
MVRSSFWKIVIPAIFGLGTLATFASDSTGGAVQPLSSTVVSLAELRDAVAQHGRSIQSFRAEGLVCALDRDHNLLAIQDSSAAVILEAPVLDGSLRVGDLVGTPTQPPAWAGMRRAVGPEASYE